LSHEDEGDEGFRRRRRGFPFGSWPFGGIDEMMRDIERAFSEQFKEFEKEIPKNLVREKKLPDGTVRKEIGPIVYGYSMTVGPDGKPVVREFGNVRRGEGAPWRAIEDKREPLVDVVSSDKEVRVIAEIPGVSREDVDVTVNEKSLVISVDTERRKYHKELDLPGVVDPQAASSTYNNGVLEVTLPLKSKGGKGVRVRVE